MDVKQIERLMELLAKATPGPWQAMNPYQWDSIIGDIDGPDDGDMHYESVTDITSHHDRSRANAALIAEAINALPALLQLARAVSDAPKVKVYQGYGGYAEIMLPPHVEEKASLIGQTVALVPVPVEEGKDA